MGGFLFILAIKKSVKKKSDIISTHILKMNVSEIIERLSEMDKSQAVCPFASISALMRISKTIAHPRARSIQLRRWMNQMSPYLIPQETQDQIIKELMITYDMAVEVTKIALQHPCTRIQPPLCYQSSDISWVQGLQDLCEERIKYHHRFLNPNRPFDPNVDDVPLDFNMRTQVCVGLLSCIVEIPYHYQEDDEKDPSSLLLQLLRHMEIETYKQDTKRSGHQDAQSK